MEQYVVNSSATAKAMGALRCGAVTGGANTASGGMNVKVKREVDNYPWQTPSGLPACYTGVIQAPICTSCLRAL
jgi:hypothetical protein